MICAHELAMADEAFALSPISARAALPSEADYDAIQEAFMETSRGRWFLGEYAKRNRNADTKMVLDAVARVEETITAQKKPVRDPLLDEALASLRMALGQAREAATVALGDLALEQNLAPVRKGARVIREIAWRLREIGADGRICDLIDSQVAAIEGAATKLAPSDLAGALSGAFDRIEEKIAAFNADDVSAASPPPAGVSVPEAADAAPVESAQAVAASAKVQAQGSAEVGETMQASSAPEADAMTEAKLAPADPAVADEPPMMAASETASEPADAFDANDEAMLDIVAMEMAAPDTDAAYEIEIEESQSHETQANEAQVSGTGVREAGVGATQINGAQLNGSHVNGAQVYEAQVYEAKVHEAHAHGHPIDTPHAGKIQASAASYEIDVTFESETGDTAGEPIIATALPIVTPLQPASEPAAKAEAAPSLGSSLLANGIVPQPRTSRPDPLAPIRRMSQNEKIAFFS
jgi:hypothetical protein